MNLLANRTHYSGSYLAFGEINENPNFNTGGLGAQETGFLSPYDGGNTSVFPPKVIHLFGILDFSEVEDGDVPEVIKWLVVDHDHLEGGQGSFFTTDSWVSYEEILKKALEGERYGESMSLRGFYNSPQGGEEKGAADAILLFAKKVGDTFLDSFGQGGDIW